jgi:amino acid adenylation domain-containing protein
VSTAYQEIEGFALSPQQSQLWNLMKAGGGSSYVARCAVLIEGDLDKQALRSSLDNLIWRHEILRTTFHLFPGLRTPTQVIAGAELLALVEHDLTTAAVPEQDALIARLYENLLNSYVLEQPHPLQAALVRVATHRHVLLLGLPALCADAATMHNLLEALANEYGLAREVEAQAEAQAEPLQYADLAEWQNELLEGPDTEAGRDFWRVKDQAVSGWVLPRLRREQAVGSEHEFEPRVMRVEIAADLAERVRAYAAGEGVPEAAYYFACWQVLLWRMAGESPLLCGLYCDGRTHGSLKEALGPLGKILPVSCVLQPDQTFTDVLRMAGEQMQEAARWAVYFAPRAANESRSIETPEGQNSRAGPPCHAGKDASSTAPCFFPLCYEWGEQEEAMLAAGLSWTMLESAVIGDRFEVKLRAVRKRDGSVVIELNYDQHLFASEEMTLLVERYLCLLHDTRNFESGSEQSLIELEVLGQRERRLMIDDWNQTRSNYGEARGLARLFEEQAERTPEAIALVFEKQELTYRELNLRADQLARYLRNRDVNPDSLVAVYLERSAEMVVALLGVLKAGGAYVPLDPMNPRARLTLILEDAGAAILLTQERLIEGLPEHSSEVVCLDRDWKEIARASSDTPRQEITADNLAYVIYTSGSTGKPKGVMVSQGAIFNRLKWGQQAYPLGATDRVLQGAAFGFDFSVWEIFAPLCAGACLVIPPPWGHQDSALLVKLIAAEAITAVHFVPTLFQLFLEEPGVADCRSLKYIFSGGEALPAALQERCFDYFEATLFNQYGPTEATIDATFWECRPGEGEPTYVPIGRPIANTDVYLLDARVQPVPIGVPGELCIAGVGLARGYLNRPELTAERFMPHPFSSERGARLYRTGDLARYSVDGSIEFLGRLDHQVKLRGTRIELGEIESILTRHPEVKEAALAVCGEGLHEKLLVAYIVARHAEPPTVGELHSFLKERLPDHMIPSAFVTLNELPLTPSGKVDRRALPQPDHNRPALAESLVLPRTVVEEVLAGVWCKVLKLEQVGIHDNFFELGGHSLLVIQVISRVREAFHVDLPVRRVFETATIAELAEVIESEMKTGLGRPILPLLPSNRDSDLPLSFAQQRLWFLHQLEPDSHAYNISEALRLLGQLNIVAMEQALNEIKRRHEVLRTSFGQRAGEPVQVIAEAQAEPLLVIDLGHLPVDMRLEEARRLATIESQLPFDLEHGPLWRAQLLQLDPNEHVLLTTMHHIVFDAWSSAVFLRELTQLYSAFKTGQASPLTELTIQYADFASWQRQWLSAAVIAEQVAYWKQQLAGARMVLELPSDQIRPPVQTQNGARASRDFSPELSAALAAISRRENVTLFMTLLTAFNVLLRHYTRQDDILVGTNSAGRNRSEIEGLIGFFVNMLVIRTKLGSDPTFRELLAQVRETTLGAYANQDLPFDMLVDELKLARDLSSSPIFQIVFTLQNAPRESLRLEGLSLTSLQVRKETTKFDVVLNMFETSQGLVAAMAYNSDIFSSVAVDEMLALFGTLLDQVAQRPDASLSELDQILSEARQGQQVRKEEEFTETRRRILKTLKRRPVSETKRDEVILHG